MAGKGDGWGGEWLGRGGGWGGGVGEGGLEREGGLNENVTMDVRCH